MCVCVGMYIIYIYIYIMKAGDETRAVLASAARERGRWFPAKERGNRYTHTYIYYV